MATPHPRPKPAAPAKPTTANQPAPPYFQDSNHNGKLDGSEMVAALDAEALPNKERSPNQHAHGVVEEALAEVWDMYKEAKKTRTSVYGDDAAITFMNSVIGRVIYIEDQERKIGQAQFRQQEEQKIKALKLSPADEALTLADRQSLIAFAEQFGKVFPRGISMGQEDFASIFNHFANVKTVDEVAPPLSPANGSRTEKSI